MLMTVETFRDRIQNDCDGLIASLQELTGRGGQEEAKAWEESLKGLNNLFCSDSLQELHLYFGSRGHLSLEYQLPASSSWCDVVLLGRNKEKPAAVIVELKNWQTRSDKAGRYEGLITRQNEQVLHPSEQVRGYTEYCRHFHSTIHDYQADVSGCVLITKDHWAPAYGEHPNTALVEQYPIFTLADDDVTKRIPDYFRRRIDRPDQKFAEAFETGKYRQDRGFVAQIGQQIKNPKAKVFELLDNQRKAFALTLGVVHSTFKNKSTDLPPKRVIIVKGPPGSGKSVIAARLWAALVTDPKMPPGDLVLATTSLSQNSNWKGLLNKATKISAVKGIVRKATTFCPITTLQLGTLRKKFGKAFLDDASEWRQNLERLKQVIPGFRDGARDDQNLVTIVDEAHGLINPEHVAGRGQFGFVPTLGPQAYHIIRSSLITVFLLDPEQGFRERENTTIDDLCKWSRELGAGDPEFVSLEGSQFRCAGSVEYVSWVESLLQGKPAAENRDLANQWQRPETDLLTTANRMDFRIFEDPESMEKELRARRQEGLNVRLLSTYSRKWNTEGTSNPHEGMVFDFDEPYEVGGVKKRWQRIWNFVANKGADYTWYVMGHPAGQIANDPLCEVGCPYAVRGFDYDYVGILWLDDLLWRRGKLIINPHAIEERGFQVLANRARREGNSLYQQSEVFQELHDRVAQAYRIIFTRALKGVYVWVPDSETREYLRQSMVQQSQQSIPVSEV